VYPDILLTSADIPVVFADILSMSTDIRGGLPISCSPVLISQRWLLISWPRVLISVVVTDILLTSADIPAVFADILATSSDISVVYADILANRTMDPYSIIYTYPNSSFNFLIFNRVASISSGSTSIPLFRSSTRLFFPFCSLNQSGTTSRRPLVK